MTSNKASTTRSFSTSSLAKCFFCVSLGALAYYLAPLLVVQLGSRRVSHDIKNKDRPGETVAAHLITGNRHLKFYGKDYGLHEHENVLNTHEQTNIGSVKYHGRDFLKDSIFTFDKRFKNPCWYEEDTLKCLPYFFVIGVKKCGTSTIFSRILKLSGVVKPAFQKEAQFFARHRFKDKKSDDIVMYVKMFNQAAKIIQKKSESKYFKLNKTNPYITGEGSPSNLHFNSHWINLPGNENLTEPKYVILDYIKHFLPDAKIIITFRDPIPRLYSDYYQELKNMHGSFVSGPEHFHNIVVDGLRMYRDCFSKRTVRSCVYDPTYYDKTKMQMQLGIYYIYWEELLRVFPRDQILVLQKTDLSSKEPYLKIQTFLGLDPVHVSDVERITKSKWYNKKASGKPPMLNKTFALLYGFYKPFNEKMAALMKDETFLYKHDIV